MHNYLTHLTLRLSDGVGRLSEDDRRHHVEYLRKAQQPDGGFAGREGGSDLYYTGFAVRALAVLGELHGPLATNAAGFLRRRMEGHESIVDFFSLIYAASLLNTAAGLDVFDASAADWRVGVARTLERLRRSDGGYAKALEGSASSTYHTFLVLVCLQLIEMPLEQPEAVIEFLQSQQNDEGGYREIRAQKRAGTNPTAAAIGSLKILDALDKVDCEPTIEFLASMQLDEGGLRANTRIPIADLLSTFTGSLTLSDLGALHAIDEQAASRYVRTLALPGGGFHGASWDEAVDVEYTFYGLGALAMLVG